MVKPHQSESNVAPLFSYIMQFTCHTKQKRFLGTEPILLQFCGRDRFRSGVVSTLIPFNLQY